MRSQFKARSGSWRAVLCAVMAWLISLRSRGVRRSRASIVSKLLTRRSKAKRATSLYNHPSYSSWSKPSGVLTCAENATAPRDPGANHRKKFEKTFKSSSLEAMQGDVAGPLADVVLPKGGNKAGADDIGGKRLRRRQCQLYLVRDDSVRQSQRSLWGVSELGLV